MKEESASEMGKTMGVEGVKLENFLVEYKYGLFKRRDDFLISLSSES
jgi:hypothetical protein